MASAMHEPHFLVLLSTLVSVAAAFYFLSLSQQDTLAQRQQIPGIKFNTTNASSSTTLSNTTIMPEFDSDTNNKNNLSLEPCYMPPCPPGEMCIQVCPESELQ
jgi:hypothetical protein